MTGAPQQEYIITLNEIRAIYDLEHWMWLMISSKDWVAGGYKLTDISALRSRPVTTSAEQVLEIVYPFVSTYDYPENPDWIMVEKIIKPLKEYFLRRECGV